MPRYGADLPFAREHAWAWWGSGAFRSWWRRRPSRSACALWRTILTFRKNVFEQAGVESVSFDELVKISDYISIHSPLLPETHHLFNAEVFAKMKPRAYLVNTARGPDR